ncbi:hypothetical protein O9489_18290, partial [Proteus mirabilis]|uniref:hypothetical protein n=1 Tax=Proteus mirabilis TaxID=584 RepID=UPI002575A95A
IFSEQESHAAYQLRKHDVIRLDVVNFISHGIIKDDQQNSDDQSDMGDKNPQSQQEMPQRDDRMDNFTTNLNQLER